MMSVAFFYSSIILALIALGFSLYFRRLNLAGITIGITSIGYSLAFDNLFGHYFGLYYYITPKDSTMYTIIAGILLYPVLNVIYTLFLPNQTNKVLTYTLIWIAAMMVFEHLNFAAGTVVLTGWKVIPWSVVIYIVTYGWVYIFYRYLTHKGLVDIKYLKP